MSKSKIYNRKRKFDDISFDDNEEINEDRITKSKKKKINGNADYNIIKYDDDLNLQGEDKINSCRNISPRPESLINNNEDNNKQDLPRVKLFYYINSNKLTLNDLKDGRRIFNNRTELSGYTGFREEFIEFRQLLFPNLLLNDDFTENLKEAWTMESAVFSTFCYEEDFIEPLINKHKIKTVIIKHADNTSQQLEEKSNLITFVHPKIDFTLKWGKFHSKLIIFKFPNFIRVVIPSANLTSGDWYYWGQIIWFQDFPLKKRTHTRSVESDFESYFEKVLDYTLPVNYKNKQWYKNLNFNVSDYDFSDCIVDLVASSSGRFTNNSKEYFGIGRLKYLAKTYSSQRKSFTEVESGNPANTKLLVQCSSIGKTLKEKFLSDICDGFLCSNKTVDIIYPTTAYVNSFQMGPQLSGCLFLSNDTFLTNRSKFKKLEVQKDREDFKTVFHSKFIISYGQNSDGELNEETLSDNAIFYFGSHNLSTAAWGSSEKKDTQISVSNFELGVVFNPIKTKYEEKRRILNSLLINLNAGYYSKEDRAFIAEDY